MKNKYDVAIVGGGVIGCSIAYYLAKNGVKDIVVFEKDYLSAGSTGRCAGGIRAQWSEAANCRLAALSIKEFNRYDEEVADGGEWYEGGYVLCAYTDDEVERFKKTIAMQREVGLDVNLIEPEKVLDVIPDFNIDGLQAAAYCPTDGHANPFRVTMGYAQKAKELGADVFPRTEVMGLKKEGNKITSVVTSEGECSVGYVVNAAGAFAGIVGEMAGLDLPVKPVRHQIMVTEPIERVLDPLVVNFHHNIYFRQAQHGAIIAGQSDKDAPTGFNINEHWQFLHDISKKLTFLMPVLKDVAIVRQWSGAYTMTPDAQPIIGKVSDSVENFLCAIGYSGHGFMLAPATGMLISEIIREGKTSTLNIDNLSMERFKDGAVFSKEANVV